MSKYDPSTKRLLEATHRKRGGLFWPSAASKQGSSSTLSSSSTNRISSTRVPNKPTTKTNSTESLRFGKLKISNSRPKIEELPVKKESFLQSMYASSRPSSSLRKTNIQPTERRGFVPQASASRNLSAKPSNRNSLILPSLSRKPSDLIPTITNDLLIEPSIQSPYSARVSQSLYPSSNPSRENSSSNLAPLPPSISPNTSTKGLPLLKRASKILFRKTENDILSRPLHPQVRELLIEADRTQKPVVFNYIGHHSPNIQCGLINPHFLCYMNSSIQFLTAVSPLIAFLIDESFTGEIANAFKRLLISMRAAGNRACETNNFRTIMSQKFRQLAYTSMEDAEEFLGVLLAQLHEELSVSTRKFVIEYKDADLKLLGPADLLKLSWETDKRLHGESAISDLFRGIQVTIITCNSCKNISRSFQSFFTFGLHLPAKATRKSVMTIESLFESASHIESLDDYKCDACKSKLTCTKKIQFAKLPSFFIVYLVRFEISYISGDYVKNETPMSVPLHVKVPEKCLDQDTNTDSPEYGVVGAIHHSGHREGGHYVAEVNYDGSWYEKNDSFVSNIKAPRRNDPYVLMLRRKDL